MLGRVLLVDVEVGISKENEESQLWTGEGSQLYSRWAHHPLGLMYLAAAVRERFPDVDVEIYHTVSATDPDGKIDGLFSLIEEFDPDLIGLRALSIAQKDMREVAQRIREARPNGTHLIAGGPHPSAAYEDILEGGEVDLCVIGEGEATFIEIVDRLCCDETELPMDVPGTAVLEDGTVKVNKPRALISDIDALPLPAHDLIDLDDYVGISHHSFTATSRSAFIEASRGCPYTCFYCHQTFGKRVRRHSPERVVTDMRQYRDNYGITNFVFVDDLFNVPKEEAKKTLRLIAQKLPDVRINFPNGLRADSVDEEMVDLLEAAGARHLAIAVETAIPRLQYTVIGKHLDVEKAREVLGMLSERFVCGAFFMIGFPTETYEEALETIRFAEEQDHLVAPILNTVRLFRGTPLFHQLKPDAETAKKLAPQETGLMQPKLAGEDVFYGDLFPDDKVPLKSEHIKELRYMWLERVFFNPVRIRNAQRLLEKHMTHEEMLEFYRNQMDDPDFDERKLEGLLDLGRTKSNVLPEPQLMAAAQMN